ncbi:hypothetical protein [Streptomyces sp. NPDC088752]|uniref:hypothetical protein n=1 Tax=Streptomyces sp. NPDC088752 TaxID=3154963 RepID=UPI00343F66FE
MALGAFTIGLFGGFSLASEPLPAASQPDSKPTEDTIPGDGTFRVGPDVSPGLYRSYASGNLCIWERTKDATGEAGSVRARDTSKGSTYATLKDGDFFTTSGCNAWQRVK